MSKNEDVNVVLETVTSTIRSLVALVDAATHTIGNHNTVLGNLVQINEENEGKIRELQSQVYALRQELDAMKVVLSGHSHPHGHSHLVGDP